MYFNHILFQRKRKIDDLRLKIEESNKKQKSVAEMVAKAKVGREENVSCFVLIVLTSVNASF